MTRSDTSRIDIPEFSLVVLIGATGSGKSTFAARWFKPTEVISSDYARGLVADDENDQAVSADAFDLVRAIAEKRLKHRRLTVIDATNVRAPERRQWVEVARRWHALPVAVVLDPGLDVCIARNKGRADRDFGPGVPQRMISEIRKSLRGLQREGFRQVWTLSSAEAIDAAQVERRPLWTDRRDEGGPFDIIGDVHGCADELEALLDGLGYQVSWHDGDAGREARVASPAGRKLVFVGDLVDRGPRTPDVLRIAMAAVTSGIGFAVQGNHDNKLQRWLDGRDVKVAHGLQASIDQLARESDAFKARAKDFLYELRSHYWLDGGRLAVAHAGLKEEMIGRGSPAVRDFALYGETTGETDEFGLPVRANWAADYRGMSTVVYGHTPIPDAEWVNNTICIDTGCVFGGRLTALRWPEKELIAVPAARTYSEPVRPLAAVSSARSAQSAADDLLDYADVSGRRWIDTELMKRIVIAEESAAAALEAMSRFAIAPQWLIYLPPTMSPVETSAQDGWLERPEEAFAFFRSRGQSEVVLQEKHMGSRAVIAVCRDPSVARGRFGTVSEESGAIWTRTGRPFFADRAVTDEVLGRLRAAIDGAGLWDELASDWGPARRRDHALVGQGIEPDRKPVRAGWRSLASRLGRRADGHRACRGARRAGQRPARPARRPRRPRGEIREGVGALCVACFRRRRSPDRALPPACERGRGPFRQATPLAHGDCGADRRGRQAALGHALGPARARRPGRLRQGGRLVGGDHRKRRRRHGGQACCLHRPRRQGAHSARPEGARTGVSAHHLRP